MNKYYIIVVNKEEEIELRNILPPYVDIKPIEEAYSNKEYCCSIINEWHEDLRDIVKHNNVTFLTTLICSEDTKFRGKVGDIVNRIDYDFVTDIVCKNLCTKPKPTIYKATSPSNKVYIGQSSNGLTHRVRRHYYTALVKRAPLGLLFSSTIKPAVHPNTLRDKSVKLTIVAAERGTTKINTW
jgi:hypothetical protein